MLRQLHDHAIVHIDNADSCCMEHWRGAKEGLGEIIGWIPTPFKEHVSPVSIVGQCARCHTKWWTHYCWIPVPLELLSDGARELLAEVSHGKKKRTVRGR